MAGSKFLMTMKLTTQGDVKGSSTKKEGTLDMATGMECHGFDYKVETQIDPNSGAPIGRRRHHPITVRREVDAASPKLIQGLVTNEVFTAAKLSFNRVGPDGKPYVAHTIELVNGVISSYRTYHGIEEGAEGTSREQYSTNELEEFDVTFQKVTVTWQKGGITANDDWLAG
jgi:type VI secretion system secreted protein Hcp